MLKVPHGRRSLKMQKFLVLLLCLIFFYRGLFVAVKKFFSNSNLKINVRVLEKNFREAGKMHSKIIVNILICIIFNIFIMLHKNLI